MLATTAGQLLVNEALPPELRDYTRKLDKSGTAKLFQLLAEKYPEKYKEISHKLWDIGKKAATESGGYSFGVEHLRTPEKVNQLKKNIKAKIDQILRSAVPDERKQEQIIDLMSTQAQDVESTLYDELLKAKNPLALQVVSGARGNPGNLRSIMGGDMMYEDHRGRPIPIPVLSSYSQGLSPVEYWAGSFGTRKGVADLKFATQDAGFFGKQLNQITHRLVITSPDAAEVPTDARGMPVRTDDPDNEGALLSLPVGGYKRNTPLTPKILADLKARGFEHILVRSPIIGGPVEGGLYAADVGIRERGGLPPSGDNVGMAAAQALSEPVTQGSISSKHKGGVAGASTGQDYGFKTINQLVQVPKTYTGGAAHAQNDGRVNSVYDAPAGGKYVLIGASKHYVHTGFEPKVKVGDTVEAGDIISDGLPNPSEIVRHKGIGEGRRYFIDILRDVFSKSGMKGHRRNMELLARGLINHVKLTDEVGDYVPDDIVPYDMLEHMYQPRKEAMTLPYKASVGKYLEKPVLHYTVGTQIKPSMFDNFQKFGVKNLTVHPEAPPFEPQMVRAMESLVHDPDWMTRQLGTNLRKGLLRGAHRGATSDETGTSFVPNLARASDFGRVGATKGWKSQDIIKLSATDEDLVPRN